MMSVLGDGWRRGMYLVYCIVAGVGMAQSCLLKRERGIFLMFAFRLDYNPIERLGLYTK